jgi:hypothetical protein
MSGPLPGAEGTIMRMAFAGYGVGVCAMAVAVLQLAHSIAESINVFCIIFPPLFFPILAF